MLVVFSRVVMSVERKMVSVSVFWPWTLSARLRTNEGRLGDPPTGRSIEDEVPPESSGRCAEGCFSRCSVSTFRRNIDLLCSE